MAVHTMSIDEALERGFSRYSRFVVRPLSVSSAAQYCFAFSCVEVSCYILPYILFTSDNYELLFSNIKSVQHIVRDGITTIIIQSDNFEGIEIECFYD